MFLFDFFFKKLLITFFVDNSQRPTYSSTPHSYRLPTIPQANSDYSSFHSSSKPQHQFQQITVPSFNNKENEASVPVVRTCPSSAVHVSDYSLYHPTQNASNRFVPTPTPIHARIQSFNSEKETPTRPASIPTTPMPSTPMFTSTPAIAKLDVPPLNTMRLLPNKVPHQTKDVKLQIHEDGFVEIDFFKKRLRFLVSGDGMQIIVVENGRKCEFSFHTLPTQHWKRYKTAYKFVEMVKAKTAKITYFSMHTKFQLMETLEDFEADFYNGIRITKTTLTGIQATQCVGAGKEVKIAVPQEEWKHFEECMAHCLNLNKTFSEMAAATANVVTFPIRIGRRPTLPSQLKPISSCPSISTNNQHHRPFTSQTPQSSHSQSHQLRTTTSSMHEICKNSIPDIGTIIQYSNGLTELNCYDGVRIKKHPNGDISHAYSFAEETTYKNGDFMPRHVRDKMQLLYNALDYLEHQRR